MRFSEVESTTAAFPFAKIHYSPLRAPRPCPWSGASWRAEVGRVRNMALLSSLR